MCKENNSSMEYGSNIPKGWVETTLGEVCNAKGGKRLPKGETLVSEKTNHPYIRITDFNGNSINKNNLQFVPDETFFKIARYIVNKNDVIISIVGTIGLVARIDKDLNNASLTENCVKLINLKEVDDNYLFYYLTSSIGQYEISKNTVGAVQKKLPIYGVQNINIVLPPLPEQKSIAKILTAFDDKIELLQEQNKTLETTAQTIFKEWFGKYQIGDELPEGWRVGKLGEIVNLFDSQRIPLSKAEREERKGEYRYYGATSVMDFVDDYLFDGIYLLFAEDGSVIDDKGYPFLQYVWGKFWVNNHAHILQGKNGFSTEMLYILCKKMKVAEIVNGAVQLKINQKNLLNYELIIPSENILKKIDDTIQPILSKIRINSDQIQTLKQTRDTLLPKLMSGQLRVDEFKE